MKGTLRYAESAKRDHHGKPMVAAEPFVPVIQELYRRGMSWTHLQMACGVSKQTIREIAYGDKHYIQRNTAYRLTSLLSCFTEEDA